MIIFRGYLFCQVLWDTTRCGKPAIAAPFYRTLPTVASWGIRLIPHLMLLHHLISTVFKTATLSFTNRCCTQIVLIGNFFFPFDLFYDVPRWLTCIYSWSLGSIIVSMESDWQAKYFIQTNEHCNSSLTTNSCPEHNVLWRGEGLYNSN